MSKKFEKNFTKEMKKETEKEMEKSIEKNQEILKKSEEVEEPKMIDFEGQKLIELGKRKSFIESEVEQAWEKLQKIKFTKKYEGKKIDYSKAKNYFDEVSDQNFKCWLQIQTLCNNTEWKK